MLFPLTDETDNDLISYPKPKGRVGGTTGQLWRDPDDNWWKISTIGTYVLRRWPRNIIRRLTVQKFGLHLL